MVTRLVHADSCQFYLAPCCDPPSQKRCATSLDQSLCWLRRAVQTPGRRNPHDLHAAMQCDRKFELPIESPHFFVEVCVVCIKCVLAFEA